MTGTSPGELKRSLTLVPTTAIVVGTIIGASIFVQPLEITALVPSLGGVAAIWFAAGVSHVIAGSDYPHKIGSLRKMLDGIAGLSISDQARADILGNNTARLLGS